MNANGIFLILGIALLMGCKQKQGPDVAGSWTAPIPGMEPFRDGFTLNADGSASGINIATLRYEKWSVLGDRLILQGQSMGNGTTIPFTDTFTITKSDGEPTITDPSGRVLNRTDSAAVATMVREYTTTDCYTFTGATDTALLSYRRSGDQVLGTMEVRIGGKDRNFGMLTGSIKGDTLIADYTFTAEGMESQREVVMLKQGDAWVEGVGEVAVSGTKASFKDRAGLKFTGISYAKSPCE